MTQCTKTDHPGTSRSIKEIELITNNLPNHKASGTDGFMGEFYQIAKEWYELIPYNWFQRTEAKDSFLNSPVRTDHPNTKAKGMAKKGDFRPTSLLT